MSAIRLHLSTPAAWHAAPLRRILPAIFTASVSACAHASPFAHDMQLAHERGDEGFLYMAHPPSGKWIGRECQLRVPAQRPLPEPLAPDRADPLLSVLVFGSVSAASASIVGGVRNVQVFQNWRWWWINMPVDDGELRRPPRLGVQVFHPAADAPRNRMAEPMEVFELPRIDALPPQAWSDWAGPSSIRAGHQAWHTEVHRRADTTSPPPGPGFPFEVRCRAGLWDTPFRRQARR